MTEPLLRVESVARGADQSASFRAVIPLHDILREKPQALRALGQRGLGLRRSSSFLFEPARPLAEESASADHLEAVASAEPVGHLDDAVASLGRGVGEPPVIKVGLFGFRRGT